MPHSKAIVSYFQIPLIVANHPDISGDHIFLFMRIYDRLRQPGINDWNKTNEELSKLINVSESVLKRKLNDLEEWGFLTRRGLGANRKFLLGHKFNNGVESDLVQNNNRVKSDPVLGQKRPGTGSNMHYIDKSLIKNIINSSAHAIKNQNPKPKKSKHPKPTAQDYQDYIQCKPGSEWVGEYRKDMGLQ